MDQCVNLVLAPELGLISLLGTVPTPFASHAFHPVDGYLQSVPYHMICYMIPIHKYL